MTPTATRSVITSWRMSRALGATLRTSDHKARIGGEEMCLLLPESDRESGSEVAERVRKAITELQLRATQGLVPVSASLGGATWRGRIVDDAEAALVARKLMADADASLYESKRNGRNRVTWSTAA